MKATHNFLAIFVGIIIACTHPALAQKGVGSPTGLGQEPEKPSLTTMTGELVEIKTWPCENTTGRAYIGTLLYIKNRSDGTVLNIHLGAAYAVESFVTNLSEGEVIEVQGFRTGQMKPDNYIAKQVTAGGHILLLRDENLRPFWADDSYSQRNRRNDFHRRGRW